MALKYAGIDLTTYRKQDEDNVFNDVATGLVANAHQCTPTPPVFAFCHAVFAPAAECFVQVEFASIVYIAADSSLQVAHPIARDVNACRNTANSNTCRNQDQPYLARVCQHSQLSEYTRSICQKVLETHALFAVLVYPIDRREVVVAHTPSRALDIPVKTRGILIVL
jgi:hypothetical protein